MSADARRPPTPARPGRAWVTAAALAALVLAASFAFDGGRPVGPEAREPDPVLTIPDGTPCDRWRIVVGRGAERGTAVSLYTDGLAVLPACSDVPRVVRLEGSAVRGVGAFAVLTDAAGVRYAGFVDRVIDVTSLRGDVRLAFTNDLATAEGDRNLRATLR